MFQSKECHNHLETSILSKLPVEILVGKKNLEVRPTMINKGEIVKNLLSSQLDWDFVFCAGDDKTDEDMFKALIGRSEIQEKGVMTCFIGEKGQKTLASWRLDCPTGLITVLGEWAGYSENAL